MLLFTPFDLLLLLLSAVVVKANMDGGWFTQAMAAQRAQVSVVQTTTPNPCVVETVKEEYENDRSDVYRHSIQTQMGLSNALSNSKSSFDSQTIEHGVSANVGAGFGPVQASVGYNHKNEKNSGNNKQQNEERALQSGQTKSYELVIPPYHTLTISQDFEVCGKNRRPLGPMRYKEAPIKNYEERVRENLKLKTLFNQFLEPNQGQRQDGVTNQDARIQEQEQEQQQDGYYYYYD